MKKMKNMHSPDYSVLLLAFAVLMIAGCESMDLGLGLDIIKPAQKVEKTGWIEVAGKEMTGIKGGKPTLSLELHNEGQGPEWIKVRFDTPGTDKKCEVVKLVEWGYNKTFTCPLEEIVANTDYPATIDVYLDEKLTRLADTYTTIMRFDDIKVQTFQKWQKPPTLPAVFKNVAYEEGEGYTRVLYGATGKARTLSVGYSELTYKGEDRNIVIPIGKINSVELWRGNAQHTHAWAVVDYNNGTDNKIIAFQPKTIYKHVAIVKDMVTAIGYVVHERNKKNNAR